VLSRIESKPDRRVRSGGEDFLGARRGEKGRSLWDGQEGALGARPGNAYLCRGNQYFRWDKDSGEVRKVLVKRTSRCVVEGTGDLWRTSSFKVHKGLDSPVQKSLKPPEGGKPGGHQRVLMLHWREWGGGTQKKGKG